MKQVTFKLSAIIAIVLFMSSTVAEAQWNQLGADIDGEAADDLSGYSVSLSSDGLTMAIGAPLNQSYAGHVRVYKYVAGAWAQQGADIDGGIEDHSGVSVSLSSDGLTVAIGSPYNSDAGTHAGQVRVYKFIDGTWTQQGSGIIGEAASDLFGQSVSLSADGLVVAIGAHFNDAIGVSSGHVRVYQLTGGVWTQQGTDIDGENGGDESGYSVSLSADGLRVAIGAPFNDGSGTEAGHVRVYELIGGVWTQQGSDIEGEAGGDKLGLSVSLSADGLTLAVGAPYNDGTASNAGHARIYKLIGGVWTQQGADIDGEAGGDNSGFFVSLSADGLTVAIGARFNSDAGYYAGHVRIYEMISGTWTQIGSDIDGEAADDSSGDLSLSADGKIVAVGARFNDGNGSLSGHTRVFTTIDGVGLDETLQESGISIFPNPSTGVFNVVIENATSGTSLKVYDFLGKEIMQQGVMNDNTIIDLSACKDGVYIVQIQNGEHTIVKRVSKL